ncbi:SPOR domain-containing protein [Xanthomonas sp. XNM01]|uniref:SPOR domain-containing protein n=1 Tax=Xanthomonas sp. XNM01 TaxID=2769289 RepID=UPI00177D0DFC|nr:SPOR domain-containing protein [Xanthomonas sp. XNM01]MBD9369662.1 SPOR domain-containing protein [Xanthomonas sp. XNM01]
MLVRTLLVVLLVLNLGVALWWIASADPAPAPVPVSDRGGVALRIAAADAGAASTPGAPSLTASETTEGPAAPADPAVPAAPLQCLRMGPFSARNVAEALLAELGDRVRRSAIEEVPGEAASYRVVLPGAADRAEAQATAERIAAAGFDDYLILNQGEDAHVIALGAFRSRDSADRRVAALQAAGFPAQLRPSGTPGPTRWWLDVASTDAAAVRARVPRAQDRDCARLR